MLMAKYDYLKGLVQQLDEQQLRDIIESYAKQDKLFEAFLLEHSGVAVETGKTYIEYRDEMLKVLEKCSTRKGFVKVTRLKNAGMASFEKLLNSHFNNENFGTALWMSLAFMEMLHSAILKNTRYTWASKPYKSFEKILIQVQEQFDSCMKLVNPGRDDRQHIFKALMRMWWRERERPYEKRYFQADQVLDYAGRDEDLLTVQLCIEDLKVRAIDVDKKHQRQLSAWKKIWAGFVSDRELKQLEQPLTVTLEDLEKQVKHRLDAWD